MHPVIHDSEHIKGVRTVALFESAKGLIVMLAALGFLSMRHKNIWGFAESLLEFLHINQHSHYAGVFLDLVARVGDIRLWKVAVILSLYVILRFVEAYGLWYALPWAEWMAAITGGIYIPFEVADFVKRATWFRLIVIVVNLLIVFYMLYLRTYAERPGHAVHSHRTSE